MGPRPESSKRGVPNLRCRPGEFQILLVACPPHQIESARRGRPFPATFSFLGSSQTSRSDSLSARSAAWARRSANRFHRVDESELTFRRCQPGALFHPQTPLESAGGGGCRVLQYVLLPESLCGSSGWCGTANALSSLFSAPSSGANPTLSAKMIIFVCSMICVGWWLLFGAILQAPHRHRSPVFCSAAAWVSSSHGA
jgi:hypothetical protein